MWTSSLHMPLQTSLPNLQEEISHEYLYVEAFIATITGSIDHVTGISDFLLIKSSLQTLVLYWRLAWRLLALTKIQTDPMIVFNEGAHRSFVSQDLADGLRHPVEDTDTLCDSLFSGRSKTVQHLNLSTVYILTDTWKKNPIRVLIVTIPWKLVKQYKPPISRVIIKIVWTLQRSGKLTYLRWRVRIHTNIKKVNFH